jgi:hypothetical protein
MIVYRATVEAVSGVDVTLKVVPAKDGEEPIEPTDGFGNIRVNVPGAANAENVGAVLRAFGALMSVEGAVKIAIGPADAFRTEDDGLPCPSCGLPNREHLAGDCPGPSIA